MLNNYLRGISKQAYNWKMLFNPDPNKPAQEEVFLRKVQSHPTAKTAKSSNHKS